MIWSAVKIAWALTRLDTCLLVFLAVLLPTYFDSNDFYFSFIHALPMLTICMCGFVINDLGDLEKDRENHPHRPLPRKMITEVGASTVYFTLLAISLISIKIYVEPDRVYLYVLLLLCLINYNYVVSYAPKLKTFYVATVGVIPIFVISSLVRDSKPATAVVPSLFLFLLSRELLMDIQDEKGDSRTLVKIIGQGKSAIAAFAIKLLGSLYLIISIQTVADTIIVAIFIFMDFVFIVLWKFHRYRRTIIHAMKIQLFVGIYYLIS